MTILNLTSIIFLNDFRNMDRDRSAGASLLSSNPIEKKQLNNISDFVDENYTDRTHKLYSSC